MKNVFITLGIVSVLALFIYVGYFLYQKSNKDPVVYEITQPVRTDIVRKTVANGSIKPRKEVELKPQISGIIEKLFVEAGQIVKAGEVVAKIKVIPDDVTLSNAESGVNQAKIRLTESTMEKERREMLFNEKVISEAEYNTYLFEMERAKEEVSAAENNLQLIKQGVSNKQTQTTTLVKSTISGMVLAVPVKEGEQVIQSNTFNSGTSIASVADMTDLIFEGKVDESEVGKIKTGMDLQITVGAIEEMKFNAKLEYISPKGIDEEGTIQFEIKAALVGFEGTMIRAGYSANADIILESRDSVLAIQERDILFEQQEKFVEVEKGEQQFEKQKIETGLSDGINIEILSGITEDAKIKVQE
ncbi:MAG: efflux RND transporter periplasmic adaptor subunit [Chitinophagales bacterium]|nr:efflux RND transporter periplasmic adaptor subunit [Chitinophagales bacterium]